MSKMDLSTNKDKHNWSLRSEISCTGDKVFELKKLIHDFYVEKCRELNIHINSFSQNIHSSEKKDTRSP